MPSDPATIPADAKTVFVPVFGNDFTAATCWLLVTGAVVVAPATVGVPPVVGVVVLDAPQLVFTAVLVVFELLVFPDCELPLLVLFELLELPELEFWLLELLTFTLLSQTISVVFV